MSESPEQQPDFAMVASKHVRCQNTIARAVALRTALKRIFQRPL